MATGACGINCDVCKLRLLGACSSCGSGKSLEASRKLEAQKRIFGGSCTILECAVINHIEYCLRDCPSFPCDNFNLGPYPFSRGFLDMQERRRHQRPPALTPNGNLVEVPSDYWDRLKERDTQTLCNLTLASDHSNGCLCIRFLQEDILVDMENRCLKRLNSGCWEKTDDPLLELITLLYLINVDSFHALGKDIIGPKDLKEAHYFKGPHELKLKPLLERYANDMDGFKIAAEGLGGKSVDMADMAFMLLPFPRVPLYYLLWGGDKEFDPTISVLFDRSMEQHFSASAIWGLVNLVSLALLTGHDLGNF